MKLSIRKFLLFNLLLAITATMLISAIGNYYLDQQEIHKNLDNLLSQAALTFQALTDVKDVKTNEVINIQKRLDNIAIQNQILAKKSVKDESFADEKERYQFQLWDKQGKLLLSSSNAPKISLAGEAGFSNKKIDGIEWRSFTIQDNQNGLIFVVAEHYSMRHHLANRIMIDDLYLMLLVYPLSGFLIWFIIGRGLTSVGRFANEVAQRAADRLDPVDLESAPSEIAPLIDELNKLFLRLKQAFDREQRFAADAAHELRTPLAALRTQAQVALKTSNPQERQMHLQQVIAGVDRCTHIIQQLLTLCRLSPETLTPEHITEVDLPKLATEIIAQLAPTAVAKQIEIELIANDPDCVLMGNMTGLHALIRNLVDNAIRYTPEQGNIKVYINNSKEGIILRVVDTGPGIPAELRSRVFERFYRVLGTNAQGSGLGLAIVQQITMLHKGTVILGVPENGKGLEVEVTFSKSK